ncbi:MAG: RDD family protein [Oceanicaulis sp.]|nr:RDD family protein [Oceanicaulis sp.]
MPERRAFFRRAAAYGVDYLVIALYALALAGVMMTLAPPLGAGKLGAYLLAAGTLTLPVVTIYAIAEARFGASPGKMILGLRVWRGTDRPSLGRSLVRNVIKFAPWEIAHIGIWLTPGQPFVDPPSLTGLILMNTAIAIVIIQAILIAALGSGVHDWIAGLRVTHREDIPASPG